MQIFCLWKMVEMSFLLISNILNEETEEKQSRAGF